MMTQVHSFHGFYGVAGGNLFAGSLNIHGKPDGKGVFYNLESGECDVGDFCPDLQMRGSGVRFSRDRDKAFEIEADILKEQIYDLNKALERVGLEKPPEERHKALIPSATGFGDFRAQQVKAWYQYRTLANLPMTDSAYGSNPYPPAWKKDPKKHIAASES
eukprot:TRINITY_DN115113_c0_g1_i1.p1 TRINITY_DN115113_c0_g1~~TRINITY_DN115113_c0_g1_i1.p1  ORF type:complete len:161 (-),score=26.67 TRINITY_DN115113_c0_g1_i1:53-535(-)